jgi:hypothetical protein
VGIITNISVSLTSLNPTAPLATGISSNKLEYQHKSDWLKIKELLDKNIFAKLIVGDHIERLVSYHAVNRCRRSVLIMATA